MQKIVFVASLLFHMNLWAVQFSPFDAECSEGETHRYDSNNGLSYSGDPIDGKRSGWITEQWGNLDISWDGGKVIKLGELKATVLQSDLSTLSAITTGGSSRATNVYSFVIHFQLGEAVFSQLQAFTALQHAAIKVRSQNLKCKVVLNQ